VKRTLLLLAVVVLMSQAALSAAESSTAPSSSGIPWMQAGPFGVMVHWTAGTMPREGQPESDWNRRVDSFPVERFVETLAGSGAKWLIFTVGHKGDAFCAPNAAIEKYFPGHCSRRDLIGELGTALHARGLKLIVYFQTEVDHESESMRQAFGWEVHPADKSEFQRRWMEAVRAYALQWGERIDGWWFDSCYDSRVMTFLKSHRAGWNNSRFDVPVWFAAARAGNGRAVVAMNSGVARLRHEVVFPQQDYLAGEANDLGVRPVGPLQDGMQWHGLVWLDCFWGHFARPGMIVPPRFEDDALYDYLRECCRKRGGVTFNVGIYADGSLAEETVAQLRRMQARWQAGFGGGRGKLPAVAGDVLSDEIVARVQPPVAGALAKMAVARKAAAGLADHQKRIRREQWTEIWPDADGQPRKRDVAGEVWNDAIEAAFQESDHVRLAKRAQPYYLDRPIVLRSGQSLLADPETEIRLKPGVNTCMVRNEHIVGGQERPLPAGLTPDEQIVVEGGIWSTLATSRRESNGNTRGRSSREKDVAGCHGVILLSNVRGVVVRRVTIRQSRAFGVHLSNCQEFLVDDVRFEDHGRDGVHVNGPASWGVIRNIRGVTHDDFIALNAWEWRNYTPTFGPIHHLIVEDARGSDRKSADVASPHPDGTAEIRLLPGTKKFSSGAKLACDIGDCVFRRWTNIRTLKLYDQPNLEVGRDKDFADPIGSARNLHFSGLVFYRPGRLQIAADVDGLSIDGVELRFPSAESFTLVEIGPMSATYKHKPEDPSTWTEIFSPDRDCTVRNLRISGVCAGESQSELPVDRLVKVIQQKPNPDYPKTTPKGGSGKGIWIR